MATYYLSASGDDNNSGLSLSAAWKTAEKFNNSVQSGDIVFLYTVDAPFVLDTGLVVPDGVTLIGVGALPITILDKDGASTTVTTTAADVRAYRPITGVFYQPDVDNYPNVWRTDDAEENAVLFRFAGWEGNTQPLVWLTRIAWAVSPLASLNSTENSYWCGGEYIDFYSATDPNLNNVYVRSTPSLVRIGILVLGGGAVENMCCGGTAYLPSNSDTADAGYAVRFNTGDSLTTSGENIFGYCSSNHVVGVLDSGTTGSTVNLSNLRYEQGQLIGTNVPFVIYGGGGSNNVININGLTNEKQLGLIGSTEGDLSSSIISLYFHNNGVTSDEFSELNVANAYIRSIVMDNVVVTKANIEDSFIFRQKQMRCDTDWSRCRFGLMPGTDITGLTTNLFSCYVNPGGITMHTTYGSISGSYNILNCTLDARGHLGVDQTCRFLNRAGLLDLYVRNCFITLGKVNDASEYQEVSLCRGVVSGTDSYDLDYNYYWTIKNDTTGAACVVIRLSSETSVRFTTLQSAGQEANGLWRGNGAIASLYGPFSDSSLLVPAAGSDLLDAGLRRFGSLDYYGNRICGGQDIGAYELQTLYELVTEQVYAGKLRYHFDIESGNDWSDWVIKAPLAPELIAADDGTFFTAGVANEIDATARAAMQGDQFFFESTRGLGVYDEALTGAPLAKANRYFRTGD